MSEPLRSNKTIFAFDFDGTLVPDTKFVSLEQCIKDFETFKTIINPDRFDIKWCIVTSRPIQDKFRLIDCLRRNNITEWIDVFTQPVYGTPFVKCDKEYDIKVENLNRFAQIFPDCDTICYVDNSKRVRMETLMHYYSKYPLPNKNGLPELVTANVHTFCKMMLFNDSDSSDVNTINDVERNEILQR